VAAAITLKPSTTAASGHNLEVVTLHAIWTSNDFLRHFEPSVLPLRVASRVGQPGNSIRSEWFFFQNLFLVRLALDQAARLISRHFLQ
jgi:hypothetical protein